jgi:hypothetical protein
MFHASRSITRSAVLALVALSLTACGGSPTSAARAVSKAKSSSSAKATTPVTTAPATGTATTPDVAAPANPAAVGSVMIMLSSLQAEGVAGVAVQLTGPGLEEPIGKTLTAEELKTSNTLAFENIPVGKLTAEVAAFDAAEESIGGTTSDVVIKADAETKVAIQLSTPAEAAGPAKVDFKFVSPDAFEAAPAGDAPTDATEDDAADDTTGTDDEDESPAPVTGTPSIDQGLSVEIVDKQTVRKFLIFKKLQVTVRVTNDHPTETLNGEVKVEFHKLKGFILKEDAIVQTLTAPVTGLGHGKSVDITLVSTESAEDAEATVHTILTSSSASTYE